jgi:hypothetical protein
MANLFSRDEYLKLGFNNLLPCESTLSRERRKPLRVGSTCVESALISTIRVELLRTLTLSKSQAFNFMRENLIQSVKK